MHDAGERPGVQKTMKRSSSAYLAANGDFERYRREATVMSAGNGQASVECRRKCLAALREALVMMGRSTLPGRRPS